MHKLYFVGALLMFPLPATAQEYQATTTSNTVVRQAPGPDFAQVGTIPAGTTVPVEICFDRGAFCLVDLATGKGFVSGELMTVGASGQTVKEAELARWAAIDSSTPSALPDYEASNIVVWGDSLSTNTFGDELENLLLGRRVSMQGVPGEDGAAIARRMLSDTRFDKRLKVIWDRHYTGETPEAYMRDLQPIVDKAAASGRFIVLSDVADLDGDVAAGRSAADDAAATDAVNAALRARYPDNYLDMTAALADPSTRTDGLHLTPQGEAAVADAIAEFIRDKGW